MRHRFKWLFAFAYTAALIAVSGSSAVRAAGPVYEEEPAPEQPGITASFGKAEGSLGDIMETSFLKFRVNAAAVADSYQEKQAEEGTQFLVLNITTQVTQKANLKLYDTDYQIQWGGEGEGDYSVPVTYRDEWADSVTYRHAADFGGVSSVFPGEAVLFSGETVRYDYVYQVPQGLSDFRLYFQEYFEDERVGDLFAVNIHADPADSVSGTLGEIVPASEDAVIEAPEPAPETDQTQG